MLEQKVLERWWEVLEQCLSKLELRYASALFWVGIECTVGGGVRCQHSTRAQLNIPAYGF